MYRAPALEDAIAGTSFVLLALRLEGDGFAAWDEVKRNGWEGCRQRRRLALRRRPDARMAQGEGTELDGGRRPLAEDAHGRFVGQALIPDRGRC